MNWTYRNEKVNSIKDVPKGAIGFVYLLTVDVEGTECYYIGQKRFFSVTNPEVSYSKYLSAKRSGKEVLKTKNKKKSKKGKVVWRYKLKNVSKESNWKTYESSSKSIGYDKYKIVKKEILDYCYTELELKYKEAKEIICQGALETERFLNKGVSLRMFGNYIQ